MNYGRFSSPSSARREKADSTYYEAVRRPRIAFDFATEWRSDSSVVFVPVFHRFETAGL